MNKLTLIGDVHGKIDALMRIQNSLLGGQRSVQLGDMGFGFRAITDFPEQHKFIRGNHDDPAKAREHKNYLGDYGYLAEDDIFYIGGANSIDKQWRTPMVSWWPDEELSIVELNAAQQLYVASKPRIVISHECPEIANRTMLAGLIIGDSYFEAKSELIKSRTCQALQQMFEIHQPKLWVFGHYHIDKTFQIGATTFRCLAELSTMEFEVGK